MPEPSAMVRPGTVRRLVGRLLLGLLALHLAGDLSNAQNCRRELWLLLDCSGSMYLPDARWQNTIDYKGQKRNLLEVSALVIDEVAANLGSDFTVRLFGFYSTTKELPIPGTGPTRSVFRLLDTNGDGRLTDKDILGGFAGENTTNLSGAMAVVQQELRRLAADPSRAVGVLMFTDGDSDYVPPGSRESGSTFALRACRSSVDEFASALSSRNALLRLVALRPNLKDARVLAEDCLRPVAGNRVTFLPPSTQASETVRQELEGMLRELSRLDVSILSLNRAKGQATVTLGLTNRSCTPIQSQRATLLLSDRQGREVQRFDASAVTDVRGGGEKKQEVTFDLKSLPPGSYSVQCAVSDGSREVGRSVGEPARFVDERLTWRIEGDQAGLDLAGKLRVSSVVAAKTQVKLTGFLLKGSHGAEARVPVDTVIWDQVPAETGDPVQDSVFEFKFRLPESILSDQDLRIDIAPDLVVSRSIPAEPSGIRIRQDPALELGTTTDHAVYRAPRLQQAREAELQSREHGVAWVLPLRVVRYGDFLGGRAVLNRTQVAVGAAAVSAPASVCEISEGKVGRCLWTSDDLLGVLNDTAFGTLDVSVRLRSSLAVIDGETRLQVVRAQPVTWTFRPVLMPSDRTQLPTWQVKVAGQVDAIPPVRSGDIVPVQTADGWVLVAPYYRKPSLDRLPAGLKPTFLDQDSALPVLWFQPLTSINPGSTTRPVIVEYECDNRNASPIDVDWQIDRPQWPGRLDHAAARPPVTTVRCSPGLTAGELRLPDGGGDVMLVKLGLVAARGPQGTLPGEVRLPYGARTVRLLHGDVWLVTERHLAWGMLGLFIFIALALALLAGKVLVRWRLGRFA